MRQSANAGQMMHFVACLFFFFPLLRVCALVGIVGEMILSSPHQITRMTHLSFLRAFPHPPILRNEGEIASKSRCACFFSPDNQKSWDVMRRKKRKKKKTEATVVGRGGDDQRPFMQRVKKGDDTAVPKNKIKKKINGVGVLLTCSLCGDFVTGNQRSYRSKLAATCHSQRPHLSPKHTLRFWQHVFKAAFIFIFHLMKPVLPHSQMCFGPTLAAPWLAAVHRNV